MTISFRRISPRVLVILGLLGLAAFILRDVLFFGQAFFERDLVWVYYSEVEAFVRAIAEGALPLRDPTIGFGQPILGSPDTQVLYPPTWLHLFLLPDRAFSIIVLFHFLIGATGAAALCWRMSRSHWASFFSGAFWMVSGPFQSTLNLWHHFAGTAWMPWVLVGFDRVLERPVWSRMLSLGALFGIQILAGSADLCAMTVLLALLRLLCEGRNLAPTLPKRAMMILGSLVLAVGLGAGVWMSALEIVRSSGRSELPRESRTEWSVHPLVATEFVFPTGIGALPLKAESARTLTDGRPPLLKSLFFGPLVLPLLVAGLLNRGASRRHRTFLAVGGVLLGLLALGRYTPLYDLAIAVLPPLRLFRYPVKVMIPLSLLVSVLGGLGADSFERLRERRIVGGLCAMALVADACLFARASDVLTPFFDISAPAAVAEALAKINSNLLWSMASVAALAGALALGRRTFVRSSLLLGVGATVLINQETNFTVPREAIRFRPSHVELVRDPTPSRLYTFDYLFHPERLPELFDPRSPISAEAFVVVVRSALMAPTGGSWKIEYAWDYDQKGLLDRALAGLTLFMSDLRGRPAFLRMLQVANVTHVADFHTTGLDGLVLQRTIPLPSSGPLYVYGVPGSLPRAYAVSGVRRTTIPEAQAMILDPTFDLHAEITLSEGVSAPISRSFEGSAVISERRSDRISIEASLNEPGHVVLLEGFLPGWQATVDGVSVPVRRANALFLAAETPAGRHRVVFTYRPRSALLGVGLTALTALVLFGALVGARSRAEEG